MKQKTRFSAISAGAIAMGLLLGASTTQAAVIFDPNEPNKATEITDLNVGGTFYDVAFNSQAFAFEIYGPFPGDFPIFDTSAEAENASDAVCVPRSMPQASFRWGKPGCRGSKLSTLDSNLSFYQ